MSHKEILSFKIVLQVAKHGVSVTTKARSVPSSVEQEGSPDANSPEKPASAKGKCRTKFSIEEKKQIIEIAVANGNRPTARMFNVASATIRRWRRADFDLERTPSGRLPGAGRSLTYPKHLDQQILEWIHRKREHNKHVSVRSIMNYAYNLINPVCPKFKGSHGWVSGFLKRHKLAHPPRQPTCLVLSSKVKEKVDNFISLVRDLRIENEVDEGLVICMGEVPIYFDVIPCNEEESVKTLNLKVCTSDMEKRHLTVLLAIADNGDVLPTLIVFKGHSKVDIDSQDSGIICSQENGCVDDTIVSLWIEEIYRQHTDRKPSVVVLDSSNAYTTTATKAAFRRASASMALVPIGCLSKLHPLDVVIGKVFKSMLCKTWEGLSQEAMSTIEKDDSLENLPVADKQVINNWMSKTTNAMAEKTGLLKKSFIVTGIAPSLDGTQDHLLRNEEFLKGLIAEFDSEDEDEEDIEYQVSSEDELEEN